ncbi:MAG: cupin domain-containing protein [Sedimenticola thiotaurini]|uniref:Cupin domain-containing protein n=1 Tax=Sedimenticola thiotaurini TaxID=1543721 RepID=A0A558D0G0_9GAMM|nr:MAG: cupin domain-containing protein [Sedimenticola thiotaurini]
MAKKDHLFAVDVPFRPQPSLYPEPFASRMAGREKRKLGDYFGLSNFGVNLTHLAPGAISALRHAHSKQDEFVYILQGHPTLHSNAGKSQLAPGMCAGFKAGAGNASNLINETSEEVIYLEIGDRTPGDEAYYPDDDLQAQMVDGQWQFSNKNGMVYTENNE